MMATLLKIITPEFIGQIILQFIILGIFMTFVQFKVAPLTAAETLKQQNFISSKKEVYFEALNIVTRHLSTYKFEGYKEPEGFVRNIGSTPVTEFEINSCQSRLFLYSDNIEIINSFKNIFRKGLNPIEQQINLINNIKSELSSDKNLKAESYEYITLSTDSLR